MHLTRSAYFQGSKENSTDDFVIEEFEFDEMENSGGFSDLDFEDAEPGTAKENNSPIQKLREIVTSEFADKQPPADAPRTSEKSEHERIVENIISVNAAVPDVKREKIVHSKPKPRKTAPVMSREDWQLVVFGNYEKAYKKAVNYYYGQQYTQAVLVFRGLVRRDAEHPLVANCQNWIGECYFAMDALWEAVVEFEKVSLYPASSKQQDAQLMVGVCLVRIGAYSQAKQEFEHLLAIDAKRAVSITAQKYLDKISRT